MKKNKYIIFTMIGFEMVALVLAAIFFGAQLEKKGISKNGTALMVVIALAVWFYSLFYKLKLLQKSDDDQKNSN